MRIYNADTQSRQGTRDVTGLDGPFVLLAEYHRRWPAWS